MEMMRDTTKSNIQFDIPVSKTIHETSYIDIEEFQKQTNKLEKYN